MRFREVSINNLQDNVHDCQESIYNRPMALYDAEAFGRWLEELRNTYISLHSPRLPVLISAFGMVDTLSNYDLFATIFFVKCSRIESIITFPVACIAGIATEFPNCL